MAPLLNTSRLVSIGPYSIWAKLTEPSNPPTSGGPTVIILPGLGESSVSWSAVIRLLSTFTRVLSYDRAGLGRSPALPATEAKKPRNASNMAIELQKLVQAVQAPAPYVLVSHSYGSIIAREFLALQDPSTISSTIKGMVFVEAIAENSHLFRPANIVIHQAMLMRTLNVYKVLGMHSRHTLTTQEWNAVVADEPAKRSSAHKAAALEEYQNYEESGDQLSLKKQLDKPLLGHQRVSIIKGEELKENQMLLEASTDPNQHDEIRTWVGMEKEEHEMHRMHLKLSEVSRFRNAEASGHEVHLTQPDMIVEEVKWVLELSE